MEELKNISIEENKFESRLSGLEKVPDIEPKKKFILKELFIGITLIVLILAGSFIINYYYPVPSPNQLNQQYYVQGAVDISNEFISRLVQCNQVPIQLNESFGNQTVNAILVECLNQG